MENELRYFWAKMFAWYLSFAVLWSSGCKKKPPNWYYYWERDQVVVGLEAEGDPKSRWADYPGFYGAAYPPGNGYCVTDLCVAIAHREPIVVRHRFRRDVSFMIGARTEFGCQSVAATMVHEKVHIANYKFCRSPGQEDTDGDGLADSLEGQAPQYFVVGCKDTYDLATALGYDDYANYGDDEFICRQSEPAGLDRVHLDRDWSFGGAQWRR